MSVNDPLVTIVVITYNSSRYIIETLDSIKNQTYKNIELIISDDCSTDQTLLICQQWLENNTDKFIKSEIVTTTINTGIPGNCNRGCSKAQGDWIKLIAGDDLLLPSCIETNLEYANNHENAKVIYSEAIKIDEKSQPLPVETTFYKNELPNWRQYFFNQSAQRQLKLYVRDPIFLISPSLFVDRTLLGEIGGFDEHLRIFEDIIFVIKVLQTGSRLHNIATPTVAYRLHSQSISKKKDKEKELRALSEFAYIYEKYRKPKLNKLNIYDLNARYLAWLQFTYALKYRLKGARFLAYANLFKVHQKFISTGL